MLWTRSHCEQLVHDQLASRGLELFLPRAETWSRRGGVRGRSLVPLFPGYLFLRHSLDKRAYVEALKARGLVRILGERWDRLSTVPDREVEAIRNVVDNGQPVLAHPYLRVGRRVRIVGGPLVGVEGILIDFKAAKGLLVLSVDLLQRSVAVEVDCTQVVPA